MPEEIPRLVLREHVPLFGERPPQSGRLTWGAWSQGDESPAVLVGPGLSIQFRSPGGEPDLSQVRKSAAIPTDTDWGVWGRVDGSRVLALSGPRRLSIADELDRAGLQRRGEQESPPGQRLELWSETGIAGLFDADPGRLLWGAWGKLDGAAVLATGGQDGVMRLWDPIAMEERGSVRTGDDGRKVGWGAWGEVGGEPVIATGGDTAVQFLSGAKLRSTASAGSAGLPLLPGHESTWGAWGTLDGRAVLAYGGVNTSAQLHDPLTNHSTSIKLEVGGRSGATTTWGSWHTFNGRPMIVTGGPNGQVWFGDPDSLTAQWVMLGHPVHWGSWGWVDNQPVLAVGDGHGEVWLYDLVWERVVPRVPNYRSDTGGAVDLLGRRGDAAALADVITARSAQPPLAVGLFGQWGDGKSMFLEMLQE